MINIRLIILHKYAENIINIKGNPIWLKSLIVCNLVYRNIKQINSQNNVKYPNNDNKLSEIRCLYLYK